LAVELDGVADARDFRDQLVDFTLDGSAVVGGVGVIGGLDGQFTDALQQVGRLAGRAVSGVQEADAVVGIANGLVEALNLRLQSLGNGHAGRVVRGAVDAQTR
jgi:hypothetical protein